MSIKLSPAQKKVVKAMQGGAKLIRNNWDWDCFLDNKKISYSTWEALFRKHMTQPSGEYTLTQAGKDIEL